MLPSPVQDLSDVHTVGLHLECGECIDRGIYTGPRAELFNSTMQKQMELLVNRSSCLASCTAADSFS